MANKPIPETTDHIRYITTEGALNIHEIFGDLLFKIDYNSSADTSLDGKWQQVYSGISEFAKSNHTQFQALLIVVPEEINSLTEDQRYQLNKSLVPVNPSMHIYVTHKIYNSQSKTNVTKMEKEIDKVDMKEFDSFDEFTKFVKSLSIRGNLKYFQVKFDDVIKTKGSLDDAWKFVIETANFIVEQKMTPVIVIIYIPQIKKTISTNHKEMVDKVVKKLHDIPTRVCFIYMDQKF